MSRNKLVQFDIQNRYYRQRKSKKIFGIVGVFLIVFNVIITPVPIASAYTLPTKPNAPTAPDAPNAPTNPKDEDPNETEVTPTPTPTEIPAAPAAPESPRERKDPTPTPTTEPTSVPEDLSSNESNDSNQQEPSDSSENNTKIDADSSTETNSGNRAGLKETSGEQTNNNNQDGAVDITTGDVEASLTVNNSVNQNEADGNHTGSSDYSVINESNGTESDNSGEINDDNTTIIDQDNDAAITNNIVVDLTSGENKIKDNLGGGSSIETGDTTSTINVINLANTNLVGATVESNEYNVVDEQSGDIDLGSLTNGCQGDLDGSNCTNDANISIENTKNGSASNNSGVVQTGNNLIITSDNFAEVNNNIDVELDTGNNVIADSLGDASIETGDANLVTNVINFLNTNIVGVAELVVNTVNILADFAGDIVLPGGSPDGNTEYAVNNSANGAESNNNGVIDVSNNNTINQTNEAEINNTIDVETNTGGNLLKDNISGEGGSNELHTGSINSEANSTTVANQNFVGDDINIIFLNQSDGITAYYIDEQGNLSEIAYQVTNEKNGADSNNEGVIDVENNTDITQNNTALLNNNIDVDANTGDNVIRDNIGGDTSIETGDVNIFVTVSNFVNSNFVGGRLVITFVNDLFDFWSGWFVTDTSASTEQDACDIDPSECDLPLGAPLGDAWLDSDPADVASEKDSDQADPAIPGDDNSNASSNNTGNNESPPSSTEYHSNGTPQSHVPISDTTFALGTQPDYDSTTFYNSYPLLHSFDGNVEITPPDTQEDAEDTADKGNQIGDVVNLNVTEGKDGGSGKASTLGNLIALTTGLTGLTIFGYVILRRIQWFGF